MIPNKAEIQKLATDTRARIEKERNDLIQQKELEEYRKVSELLSEKIREAALLGYFSTQLTLENSLSDNVWHMILESFRDYKPHTDWDEDYHYIYVEWKTDEK